MSHSSNPRRRRGHSRHVGTAVVSFVAALGTTLVLGVPSAHADPTSAAVPVAAAGAARTTEANYPTGKVVSTVPLSVRVGPYTGTGVCATLQPGALVRLKYKVESEPVEGNRIWYRLADGCGWVSARYVQNQGPVAPALTTAS
jgi:uncharacterized protein YraI